MLALAFLPPLMLVAVGQLAALSFEGGILAVYRSNIVFFALLAVQTIKEFITPLTIAMLRKCRETKATSFMKGIRKEEKRAVKFSLSPMIMVVCCLMVSQYLVPPLFFDYSDEFKFLYMVVIVPSLKVRCALPRGELRVGVRVSGRVSVLVFRLASGNSVRVSSFYRSRCPFNLPVTLALTPTRIPTPTPTMTPPRPSCPRQMVLDTTMRVTYTHAKTNKWKNGQKQVRFWYFIGTVTSQMSLRAMVNMVSDDGALQVVALLSVGGLELLMRATSLARLKVWRKYFVRKEYSRRELAHVLEALTFMAVEENVVELSAILVQAFASFYLRYAE